jgi:hypothetical protein
MRQPLSELDLSVFVEFGVGLAGFSGVVVAFTHRSGRLDDYDRFRVVQLLSSALIPAFLGLLPVVLAGFDIRGEEAWRIASAVLMVVLVANTGLAVVFARRVSAEARASLSPTVWRVALGSSAFFVVWNGLNLAGWPRPSSFGPVAAAMAWLLVMASVMFFRLLLVRLGDGDDSA